MCWQTGEQAGTFSQTGHICSFTHLFLRSLSHSSWNSVTGKIGLRYFWFIFIWVNVFYCNLELHWSHSIFSSKIHETAWEPSLLSSRRTTLMTWIFNLNTIQTEHILFQDYPEITWRGIFSLVNIYVGKAPPSLPAQLHLLKLWKETNFSQRTNCSRNLAPFPLQKHNDYGAFRLRYSYLHSYCCWQTLRFLLIVPNNKPAMHRYSNQSLSWYI